VNPPRAPGTTLQRRILALLDDHTTNGDHVTAESLAAMVALPVSDVAAELDALVSLGNLTRSDSAGGQPHYSAAPRRQMLGHMLVDAGLITEDQLKEALAEQSQTGERLGRILMDRGYVSKQTLGQMLEVQRGVPYVNLSTYAIDEALVRALPEWVVVQHKVLPLARVRREIHLAMLDPTDVLAIDTVARHLNGRVRPFLTTERDFDWAVTKFFEVGRRVGEHLAEVAPEDKAAEPSAAVAVTDATDAPPLVRVATSILTDAVRIGATDIHIEPDVDDARVRVRVDGLLVDKAVLPHTVAAAVVSRLKVLGGLDIAERLRPQDGRILISIEGREYDLRLATVGTAFGERAAIRLLNTQQVLLGLERLGLFPEQQQTLERLLARPHGMVLVTGPTGSGKTTTLYAAIRHINQATRNIMTIEDPVEYRLAGITQIPVREKAGITFDVGLRAILRQDPDVVMVGEIRDPQTASIAIQAALTGHLVLSTLHTSSAAGALVRLLDMGVEPYLLTSSVLAVAGQRLIRMLCTACRKRYMARDEEQALLGLAGGERVTLYRAQGCVECGELGYKGRTGIFELLVIEDATRDLILNRRPVTAIMATAQAAGIRTLQASARQKVLDGVTSVEEWQRLMLGELA
jgi:type IV pilus assembly protein PilB